MKIEIVGLVNFVLFIFLRFFSFEEKIISIACCFDGTISFPLSIWNHPGILQLNKEDKGYISREDTAENFLADDSSSDENMDYNVAVGGIHSSLCCFLYLAFSMCGHVICACC